MNDAATELEDAAESPESESESGKMSFLEHLDELRKRLFHIIIYVGIGLVACFYFHREIYRFLAVPIQQALPPGEMLAYTKPTDPFMIYVKVSILAGIFLTIPFSLYEVWKFIAPGLYRKEKKYVLPFLFFSIVLFVTGGLFCYYVVLPQTYSFLLKMGEEFRPVIKIDEYLDLTNMMILGFGLIFEMPVVVAFLSIFGLVSAKFLWSKFRYAVVIIVAAAAMLSPTGDAFSLVLWAAPMVLLYLVSIVVAAVFGWRRRVKGLA
jgi:sec-independent protein translocase protein TatC